MSEDINKLANKVYRAVRKREYRDSFFEKVNTALDTNNQERLGRIGKIFNLPEDHTEAILLQSSYKHSNAKIEEQVEEHARALIAFAREGNYAQRLFNIVEDSYTKGRNRLTRIARRFGIPPELSDRVFSTAYNMTINYDKAFKSEEPEKTPEN
ncbi:hypothetical protein KY309_02955 [Candidatus Woesearchaeota archaeon]|nr:hypothetical protein [Candidatus Woesearchaeota archaeon]MBW3016545.1 hypothetical protein [Candidatus Woesearchaeota archaeon]